jgi:hypothetical protein
MLLPFILSFTAHNGGPFLRDEKGLVAHIGSGPDFPVVRRVIKQSLRKL